MPRTNFAELSPTMQLALDTAREHGGELERWPGGYWTYPGCGVGAFGAPAWHIGATTVHALLARQRVEVAERAGKAQFPVRVRVLDAG